MRPAQVQGFQGLLQLGASHCARLHHWYDGGHLGRDDRGIGVGQQGGPHQQDGVVLAPQLGQGLCKGLGGEQLGGIAHGGAGGDDRRPAAIVRGLLQGGTTSQQIRQAGARGHSGRLGGGGAAKIGIHDDHTVSVGVQTIGCGKGHGRGILTGETGGQQHRAQTVPGWNEREVASEHRLQLATALCGGSLPGDHAQYR